MNKPILNITEFITIINIIINIIILDILLLWLLLTLIINIIVILLIFVTRTLTESCESRKKKDPTSKNGLTFFAISEDLPLRSPSCPFVPFCSPLFIYLFPYLLSSS